MVVFHGIPDHRGGPGPSELMSHEEKGNATFVLYQRDPPTYTGEIPASYDGYFDLTATYRYYLLTWSPWGRP